MEKTIRISFILFIVHCVKSVRIQSFSGPHFPRIRSEYEDLRSKSPYPVRVCEITDQKNSEYRHVLHSDFFYCSIYNQKRS